MPTYNSASTLLESVRSVLAQSMSNLELIVCDDASEDDTPNILRAVNDPRLKYIRNQSNLGPGLSRDRAIEQACATWIAVIDADDVWLPERLERLLEVASVAPDRLIFDDIMICHSSVHGLVPWREVHGADAFGGCGIKFRDITIEDYLNSSRLLIKPLIPLAAIRQAGLCHSSRPFGEDAEYFLRLALAGVGFSYLPKPLYLYRVQPGSLTASVGQKQMRECIESCAELDGWSDSVRAAFKRKIISLRHNETLYSIIGYIRRGQFFLAAGQFFYDPVVLLILPRRLLRFIAYQLHRLRHGGKSRASGGPRTDGQ